LITEPLETMSAHVHAEVSAVIKESKVDAVLNVAGGWAGGNLVSEGNYTERLDFVDRTYILKSNSTNLDFYKNVVLMVFFLHIY
jgi:uncharacterized protein (DUF849 family)